MISETIKGNLHTGFFPKGCISALLPSAKSLGEIWRTFGSPSDMDFGYNTKMEGYANLSSDITELYAIVEEERLVVRKKKL